MDATTGSKISQDHRCLVVCHPRSASLRLAAAYRLGDDVALTDPKGISDVSEAGFATAIVIIDSCERRHPHLCRVLTGLPVDGNSRRHPQAALFSDASWTAYVTSSLLHQMQQAASDERSGRGAAVQPHPS